MSFLRRFLRFKSSPDIKELTDFLASNETFVKAAKKVHSNN
jgi:hypothetical protein